jgi:hypothetical protein
LYRNGGKPPKLTVVRIEEVTIDNEQCNNFPTCEKNIVLEKAVNIEPVAKPGWFCTGSCGFSG